jgi:hypothetical protein
MKQSNILRIGVRALIASINPYCLPQRRIYCSSVNRLNDFVRFDVLLKNSFICIKRTIPPIKIGKARLKGSNND